MATNTYAEHVVSARGKRSQFTSVSLDLARNRDLGEQSYRLKRPELERAGHGLVEHQTLLNSLRADVLKGRRAARLHAIQAVRWVRMRKEGLVEWKFDVSGVERKDIISWAQGRVRDFFVKVK